MSGRISICPSISSNGNVSPNISSIKFAHQTEGLLVQITNGGIITEPDVMSAKTSKEVAELVFEIFVHHVCRIVTPTSSNSMKFLVQQQPILIAHKDYLELTATKDMSLYDQWVYHHLNELWKNRK